MAGNNKKRKGAKMIINGVKVVTDGMTENPENDLYITGRNICTFIKHTFAHIRHCVAVKRITNRAKTLTGFSVANEGMDREEYLKIYKIVQTLFSDVCGESRVATPFGRKYGHCWISWIHK